MCSSYVLYGLRRAEQIHNRHFQAKEKEASLQFQWLYLSAQTTDTYLIYFYKWRGPDSGLTICKFLRFLPAYMFVLMIQSNLITWTIYLMLNAGKFSWFAKLQTRNLSDRAALRGRTVSISNWALTGTLTYMCMHKKKIQLSSKFIKLELFVARGWCSVSIDGSTALSMRSPVCDFLCQPLSGGSCAVIPH